MSASEELTQKEAAERLGISTWKLRQLSNNGDVPRNDDKSYPWPEVKEAYDEIGRKSGDDGSGEERAPEDGSGASDEGEDLTQIEAAERLGISPRTLRRLSNRGDVPRNDDKSYPWPEVKEAYRAAQGNEEEGEGESPGQGEGEGDPSEVEERLTQVEAAGRLGLTARRLRQLTGDGTVSRMEDGSYPWPRIKREYLEYKADTEDPPDLNLERARWTRARAEAQEMDNAVRRGELIHQDDLEELLRDPLEKIGVMTKELPSRYGPRLAREADIPLSDAKNIMGEIGESIRNQLRDVPGA